MFHVRWRSCYNSSVILVSHVMDVDKRDSVAKLSHVVMIVGQEAQIYSIKSSSNFSAIANLLANSSSVI